MRRNVSFDSYKEFVKKVDAAVNVTDSIDSYPRGQAGAPSVYVQPLDVW